MDGRLTVDTGGKGPGDRRDPGRERQSSRSQGGDSAGVWARPGRAVRAGGGARGRARGPADLGVRRWTAEARSSRLPAALASLKLGVGELGGSQGVAPGGWVPLRCSLSLEPRPRHPLGLWHWVPSCGEQMGAGSEEGPGWDGQETRRSGKSQKQHAQWGQRGGGAVSPGQEHTAWERILRETSSAVAGAAGCGNAHPEPGEAPGSSPQPPKGGACSPGCSPGRRTLRGEEGYPETWKVQRRGQRPALGEMDEDPPTELGPRRTGPRRRGRPAVWGPGTAPLGRGLLGRSPLARTGTHLRAGAVAGPHTHAVLGGGLWGPGGGPGPGCPCCCPPVLLALPPPGCLPPPSCNLAGKRGPAAASPQPPGPSPYPRPPPLTGGTVLLAGRPRLRHCCPHRRLPPQAGALGEPGLGAGRPTGGGGATACA